MRSTNCANCRHFLPAHQCRRHAPVVGGATTDNPWGEWPRVSAGDWCGEFEPKGVAQSDALHDLALNPPLFAFACPHCGKTTRPISIDDLVAQRLAGKKTEDKP